jgi:hypothetical protein
MNLKLNAKTIVTVLAIGLLLWVIFQSSCNNRVSMYSAEDQQGENVMGMGDAELASVEPGMIAPKDNVAASSCAMGNGLGLASSLLPREMASQENFGEFAPSDILAGQNFLDPRIQIGMPETIGGTLRNANYQLRADPPNPKQAYDWNNSTIVPDRMQRNLA